MHNSAVSSSANGSRRMLKPENANNPVVTVNEPDNNNTNIITSSASKNKSKSKPDDKRPSVAYTITTFDNHSLCIQSFTHSTIDFVSIFQPYSVRTPQGNKLRKDSWMAILNDIHSDKEGVHDQEGGKAHSQINGHLKKTSSGSSSSVTLGQLEAFIARAIQTKFYGGDKDEDTILYDIYRPCYQYAFRNTKLFKRRRQREERQVARFEQKMNKLNIDSSRTNSKYLSYMPRTAMGGNSTKQNDGVNFSDFRMFSVYLCIYAQLFDIFVPRVTANTKSEGVNIEEEVAKSSGKQNDKDRVLNPQISIHDYLKRHESFDDFNFKVLNEWYVQRRMNPAYS